MSSVSVRLSAQQQFAYCPHSSVSGDTWQYIKSGICTGNGAAGGTTVVDTNGDSGGADTYNGRYWVHIISGASKGQWKRIVDDDGAGTLTLENSGFSNQIVSAVEYEIWLCPDPVVNVTSSSGETNMADTVRTEANDFFNTYYACPITGTHRGKIAQITDFASSGGVFTLAASFGSALSVGDVVLIRRFVEVGNPSASLTEGYEPRLQNRVNFAVADGITSVRGGTFGFSSDVIATDSRAASNGQLSTSSDISGLLQGAGYQESVGMTLDVGTGSTTTDILIPTASWENVPLGSGVVWNGELRFVTAYADGGVGEDTITVTPAFSGTPQAGDLLYGTRMYRRDTDGDFYGVLLEWEVDGIRTTMTGCKGNVTLNSGNKLEFAWEYQVDHYIREIEAAPYNPGTAYASAQPLLDQSRKAWLDTTATDINGFTCSLNTEVSPINVQGSVGINGRAGFALTGFSAGGTFREVIGSSAELTQELRWSARTAKDLMVVYGSHKDVMGIRMPVARMIEVPAPADDSGMQMVPNVVAAQDAGTYADPDGTILKVPDFSICLGG